VFSGTRAVYQDAGILWRTVQALAAVGRIDTPDGVRELIEEVYASSDVPDALARAAGLAEGRRNAEASTARFVTLKPTDGYDATAVAWENELLVATRVANAQTIVRLGRVLPSGSITPWASADTPWKAWGLSEVRVSARRVPSGVAVEQRFEPLVHQIRKEWGPFEQEIPLLPLEQDGAGGWRGTLRAPRGKEVRVTYSLAEGLRYDVAMGDFDTASTN
jgi:CRISPR-associated endonuclease/helicase Cas3